MLTIDEFLRCHEQALGFTPDPEKLDALRAQADATLYLVAGPGTGKTACLAARVLKLLLVDDVPADGIIATTFTTKAAAELRSRILDWGFHMLQAVRADQSLSAAKRDAAERLDVNQVVTGTLDSLCQEMLVRYRDPGVQPPVLIDQFVANTLLLRHGLFADGRFRSARLGQLLLRLDARTNTFGWHLGRKTQVLAAAADRLVHDQVDRDRYIRVEDEDEKYSRDKLLAAVDDYRCALEQRLMLDYAHLEAETLHRLRAGELSSFLGKVRAVLVDEYQDTNLLQEQIYMELAHACGGALTVVGDDDQSLYRFRGATVELFSNFPDRTAAAGWYPQPVFLQTNHRSSQRIVEFVDAYARLDPAYAQVRAANKPPLRPRSNAPAGVPILGMFRDTADELAEDLAGVLTAIFRGGGYKLPGGKVIRRSPHGGDIGDAAVLASSPREANATGTLLPGLLRQELRKAPVPIDVFNPRGQQLDSIPIVEAFGGALLSCLDPGATVESAIFLPQETRNGFLRWRAAKDADLHQRDPGLQQLLNSWATRTAQRGWPRNASALELIYAVAHYFPELHDDPEGQVYLEAFTRQLSACEQVSAFGGRIVNEQGAGGEQELTLAERSVRDLLQDFLGPIASGSIDVNEDLLEDFPHDRLPVLSIHQAKGLEFPIAIVDVGASFKTAHPAHRFKRFPDKGGAPQAMEDHFRPYTPLNAPDRRAVDRAFDDLYRQYFVAFSRARDVLLLVGLTPTLPGGRIENVATGWTRDRTCPWASARPFEEI